MEKSQRHTTREAWVDTVRIFACLLVVFGHFFQSMVKSDILPDTALYGWFNQTIYFFHVPLFFLCSGYLFQKLTSVRSFGQWRNNFLKKFISLAVPYFVFALTTYIVKAIFSDSVNYESEGLADALFLNPISPYWYLYALILIFLITVTIKSKWEALVFMVAAALMKAVSLLMQSNIYALDTVLDNEIWFVSGMFICYCNAPEKLKALKTRWGFFASTMFIVASVFVYSFSDWNAAIAFGMGIFGCISVLLLAIKTEKIALLDKLSPVLAKYTFPVFLMHTIFAAGLRSVLLKFGVLNPVVHIVLGLIISFAGPVIAAIVLEKLKYPEVLLYPNKFIRVGTKKNEQET